MRASSSPPVSPSPVTNPAWAWQRDLDARPGAETLGPSEGLWLELALTLYRHGKLAPHVREEYLRSFRNPAPVDSAVPRDDAPPGRVDVPSLVLDLVEPRDESVLVEALSVVQGIVESMENHHALNLAFATLSATRRALPDLRPLFLGRLLAQQGRVTRQIGDLDTAADLYGMVHELGTLHDESELLLRGHVGAGLVAETRGNFPAARKEYERALEHAHAEPRIAAAAHHGLMVAASSAGDLPTAFRHAWAAFEGVAGDPVRRVDRILNLAELARKAGDARVALRAFGTVLEHTELARLRLPALSGAAQSASALGERSTVMALLDQAEREASRGGTPYEHAKMWLAFAEVLLALGEQERATTLAQRAVEIAGAHAFHELDIRAAELAQGIARRGDRGDRAALEPDDAASRDALRRLDALADAGRAVIVG